MLTLFSTFIPAQHCYWTPFASCGGVNNWHTVLYSPPPHETCLCLDHHFVPFPTKAKGMVLNLVCVFSACSTVCKQTASSFLYIWLQNKVLSTKVTASQLKVIAWSAPCLPLIWAHGTHAKWTLPAAPRLNLQRWFYSLLLFLFHLFYLAGHEVSSGFMRCTTTFISAVPICSLRFCFCQFIFLITFLIFVAICNVDCGGTCILFEFQ